GIWPLYRELAAKFADAGFHTLVLDIYSREGTPQLDDLAVFALIDSLPDARVVHDVAASVAYLRARPETGRVGVVGFCLGGQYATMSACRVDGLDACVSFYGMLTHRTP